MNESIKLRTNETVKQRSSVKNSMRLSFMVLACMAMSSCGISSYPGFQAQTPVPSQTRDLTATTYMGAARVAFARGNYGIAIDHLESELARSPVSVSALNGLGSSYDQLGRYDVAQRYYFRALDLAPQSSLTIGNIGYSYLLQGRTQEAVRLLQLALRYDAENMAAAANLDVAAAAPVMVAPELTMATPELMMVTPELMMAPRELVMDPGLRIEVSNGNGINGMAARLREFLQHQGASVVRLTNAENFAHARSTVYYREGYREAAQALAETFPSYGITLEQSDALSDRVDARLLVGWDFSQFEAEKNATGGMLAQITQ